MKYLLIFLLFCSCSATETFFTNDTQADRWNRAGLTCDVATVKVINTADKIQHIKIGTDNYPVDANSTRTIELTPGRYTVNNSWYEYAFKPCFEHKVKI